jgi:hypothetical protein
LGEFSPFGRFLSHWAQFSALKNRPKLTEKGLKGVHLGSLGKT